MPLTPMPWSSITACDDSLAGEEHEPHTFVHADQVFECDGEDHRAEVDGPDNDDWIHPAYERMYEAREKGLL